MNKNDSIFKISIFLYSVFIEHFNDDMQETFK